MNIKNILFPTDFSHTGDKALAMAESLARDSGAKIFIVHVEEPPMAYGGGEMYYGIMEPDLAQLKLMLSKVKPHDEAIPYEQHLLSGEPADGLARFANENKIDLIVMGTHGPHWIASPAHGERCRSGCAQSEVHGADGQASG